MDVAAVINWISLPIFYAFVAMFLYHNRANVTTQWYIFYMYRTQTGIKFIKSLAKKAELFWRLYGYLGIPVGFLAMVVITGTIVSAVVGMLTNPQTAAPAASIVVPWGSTGVHGALITVSIWYFIVAVMATVLVHEGAHAVIAAAHHFKIKSTGFGLFAVIPFAFVEPDEDQINKSKAVKQLSIYAAGPFTNIITAGLVLCAVTFLILPALAGTMQVNGLEVISVNKSMPAGLAGLENGDTIVQVNEINYLGTEPIVGGLSFSYETAVSVSWPSIAPGEEVHITTASGKEITAVAQSEEVHPNLLGKIFLFFGIVDESKFEPRGVIGIDQMNPIITNSRVTPVFGILYNVLAWITIFNLGIGLFNLLPIGPLDGGRMMKTAVESLFKKKGAKIFSGISMTLLFILLFSIFGPFLLKLI